MNRCTGCSRDFTSVTAFDAHRTGSHRARSRRCMTTQEMAWSGLELKASGKWGLLPDERSLARDKRERDQRLQNAIVA
jgi:hypothetical protein